jgi:glucose-6-phosphate 1-epimerase
MIETLRNRFPLPGVHFHQHDRLVVMELQNEHGRVWITPMGATVLGYQPEGEREVIWVSETAHFDGSRPVRGGIPVCWPWFGDHPDDPGQKAHGFARHMPWQIESVTVEDNATRAVLRLEADETTRRIWNGEFVLRLAVTLGDSLRLDLTAENRGMDAWQITEALHSYFHVGQSEGLRIDGLKGLAYWDKQAGGVRGIQEAPLELSPPFDRVYFDHLGQAVIHDGERRIHVAKTGSASTVVWNPGSRGARAFDDMPDEAWREMVCVETANALDDSYPLEPGASHTLSSRIRVSRG